MHSARLRIFCALVLLFSGIPLACLTVEPPQPVAAAAAAVPPRQDYVPGELIVRLRTPFAGGFVRSAPALAGLNASKGLKAAAPLLAGAPGKGLGLQGIYRLAFAPDADVPALAAAYAANPAVLYAEPNYLVRATNIPDDPYLPQQWHLQNTGQYRLPGADIHAAQAWDVVTGTAKIVIAVIDTGIQRDHPDLSERIWTNPGETAGNFADDDSNGLIDDTWGWNWVNNSPDANDDNGHGTHVAGIAAAAANNGIGTAGVCWNCRLMALKVLDAKGSGNTSNLVAAINYAVAKGAQVINMSLSSTGYSQLLEDTLQAAYSRAVLVAAAGNDGRSAGAQVPHYPAASRYVLSVGATDAGCVDRDPGTLECRQMAEYRADFSDYGPNALVGAPGVSIYSTFKDSSYASLTGTSMAAPVVAGVAALVMSAHSDWPAPMVVRQIANTADPLYVVPDTAYTPLGNGRVNAYRALTVAAAPDVRIVDGSVRYDDAAGDRDGLPDAGETVTVTLALHNDWLRATGVTGVLSTADPYVTVLDGTSAFGDIAADATLDNRAAPFRLYVHPDAPNNHQVSLTLNATGNGSSYTAPPAGISFLVQRGVDLPSALFPAVITSSMTLRNDYLYIVRQNMLVSPGVTLTIQPGTRLQFDSGKFIKVQGTLIADGTASAPITFTTNSPAPATGQYAGITFENGAIGARFAPTFTLTTVATEGQPLPGYGSVISLTAPPQISPAGDVYFAATLSGGPRAAGIFRQLGSSTLPVALAGDAAPGGGVFSSFEQLTVGERGDVYFLARLADTPASSGVFYQPVSGQLSAIARVGDPVPGVSGGVFAAFDQLVATRSNSAGVEALYFSARYDGGYDQVGIFGKRPGEALSRLDFVNFNGRTAPVTAVYSLWKWDANRDAGAVIQRDGGPELVSIGGGSSGNPWGWYGSPVGGVLTFGADDRCYPMGADGSVSACTAHVTGGTTDRVLLDASLKAALVDGQALPGGGTLDLQGPIDVAWQSESLVVRAVVSGTQEVRLLRVPCSGGTTCSGPQLLSDPAMQLPAGPVDGVGTLGTSAVSAFGELALLLHSGGRWAAVRAEPGENYVSGSILRHVRVEYGSGVGTTGSCPLIADSSFYQNSGVALGISNTSLGVGSTSCVTVVRDNSFFDNRLYAINSSSSQLRMRGNDVRQNGWGVEDYESIAINGGTADLRDNVIANNSGRYTGGVGATNATLRLEGNELRLNHHSYTSAYAAAIYLSGGKAFIRRNQVTANSITYEMGSRASALYEADSAPVVEYNTFSGNLTGNAARPASENTLVFDQSPAWPPSLLTHNNIVGNLAKADVYFIRGRNSSNMEATNNWWGTTDLVDVRYHRVWDYYQDFVPGEVLLSPLLAAPEPLAPGFVTGIAVDPAGPIAAQVMTVTVDFSRDMNTLVQPAVTFGTAAPYNQHALAGNWQTARRWSGHFTVTADTGDGINTLALGGARDSDGLTIPDATGTTFVIQSAGSAAVLLEAQAGAGQVALSWMQNDVADLAGYVLYRATGSGAYQRIGPGMFTTTAYTDTGVSNGLTYRYQYSVLSTDLREVAWSNEVSAVPDDYTPPSTPAVTDDGDVTHYFDRIHATWSSQDSDTGIAEYQMCVGATAGNCDIVAWSSVGTQTEATRSGLNLVDGQGYYVNVRARNGANHWGPVGSSDGITLARLAPPSISAVSPASALRSVAQPITVTGTGFQAVPAPRLQLGDLVLTPHVASSTRITAVVPAAVPAGVYTVTVTNYDGQSAQLASAYAAANPPAGPRTVTLSPATLQVGDDETSTVSVQVQDVADLAAFQFDLSYNPAVVRVTGVTLGPFLSSGGRNAAALGPTIDGVAGRVSFGGFSYGSGLGASGSGSLATIQLAPVITGTSALTPANVQLRDVLNTELTAATQPGQVNVVHYPLGDLDRNCAVDVADIMQVAGRWNSRSGDPAYLAAYDFEHDGDIDVADIMYVAGRWGATCSGKLQTSAATDPAGPQLRLSAPTVVAPGEELQVGVELAQPAEIGAAQLEFTYDPSLFEYQSAAMGPALAATGNQAVELTSAVDTEAGRVTWSAFSYGTAEGAAGGRMVTITLVARKAGAGRLAVTGAQFTDRMGGLQAPAPIEPLALIAGSAIYLPTVTR